MTNGFILYIIAAFLSFALSSTETATDDAASLAAGSLLCENPPAPVHGDFPTNDADCESSVGNGADSQIDTPLRNFQLSNRFRLPVRRIYDIRNVFMDNGCNAVNATSRSLTRITHSPHSSTLNEPARYLIRLRKFII